MKKIILCSTQRSGSTMIVEDMRNTGILGNPEEYFIKWQSLSNNMDINEEIDLLYKNGSKGDVFSIKVMANQIKKVNTLLSNSSKFNNIKELFQGASWVYIKRNDSIKQAISRYIASVTKVNHAVDNVNVNHFAGNLLKTGHENYNSDVDYDFSKIFQEFCNVKKENIFWEYFFKQYEIEPLELTYELYATYNAYEHIEEILKFVKIDSKPAIMERKLKKLSNKVNEEFEWQFKKDIYEKYY